MRQGARTRCLISLFIGLLLAAGPVLAAPIPPDVKKSVVFLFLQSGDGKLLPSGTGFLAGVRNPAKQGRVSIYLVTAKHVLQKPDRSGFVPQAFVRFNTRDGRSDVLTIQLMPEGPGKNVFVHPDPTVDLAVVPVFEDPARYDFKVVADELFVAKQETEQLGIREGADVFYAGLFVPHVGVARNHPIVRFGKVALLSDEPINWGGKESEIYLIESASYGGNSGAPVFVVVPAPATQKGSRSVSGAVRLAGVLVGYFGEVEAVGPQSGTNRTMAAYNTGVSAVVPAYKLREILFGDALQKQRNG